MKRYGFGRIRSSAQSDVSPGVSSCSDDDDASVSVWSVRARQATPRGAGAHTHSIVSPQAEASPRGCQTDRSSEDRCGVRGCKPASLRGSSQLGAQRAVQATELPWASDDVQAHPRSLVALVTIDLGQGSEAHAPVLLQLGDPLPQRELVCAKVSTSQ
jgi:hypothetical protein